MVKIANTIEDYKRCVKFLSEHHLVAIPFTILFYAEEDSNIICVCGYHRDYGSMLEPMIWKNTLSGIKAGKEMFLFMEDYLRKIGHVIIRFRSKHQPLINLMEKHFKFKKQESETYLIKEL